MRIVKQQRTTAALLSLAAVGLAFAVMGLLGSPNFALAADAETEGETYTWNIAGAAYLEPSFFSTTSTLTTYPSNGGQYELAPAAAGDPIAFAEGSTELAGRGPHGGYDTTTMKCQTCHSAHGADYQGTSLLRKGSTGCEYCHMNSSVAVSKQVYLATDGDPTLASTETTVSGHGLGLHADVPDSSLANFELSCGSCHSVHAADNQLWKPTDFFQDPDQPTIAMSTAVYGYKLLKADPSGNGTKVRAASDPLVSDPTTDPATVNQFASAVWCMDCHDASMTATGGDPGDLEDTNTNLGYLGVSQSIDTTTFTYSGGTLTFGDEVWAPAAGDCPAPRKAPIQGLYQGPSQCYNCHRGGLQPLADGLDSTNATEAALLTKIEGSGEGYLQNAADDQAELDCSPCHYGPADFAADDNRRNQTADWPHSSSNDYALLGDWTIDPSVDPTATAVLEIPGGMTEQNIPQYVCGRCHPTEDGVTFVVSPIVKVHVEMSIQNSATEDTSGLLGTFYSPGWDSPGWER